MYASHAVEHAACLLYRSAPVCLLGWIWPKRQRTAPMGRKLQRSFEELRNGLSTKESQQIGLTVLQWNVLADGLAQYGDFEKVPASRSPSMLGRQQVLLC